MEAWGLRSSRLPGLSITSQLATGLDPQTDSETACVVWRLKFSFSVFLSFLQRYLFDCCVTFKFVTCAELILDIQAKQSSPHSALWHHLASYLNPCMHIELLTHVHTPRMHDLWWLFLHRGDLSFRMKSLRNWTSISEMSGQIKPFWDLLMFLLSLCAKCNRVLAMAARWASENH